VLSDGEKEPMSVTQLFGNMEVLIPMAGFIDKDQDVARLTQSVEKLDKEIEKATGFARNITKLKDQIEKIKAL
jgi:valyl-tRNA synthetase